MNKGILSLGAASLLLAASTLYLARQVAQERGSMGMIPAANPAGAGAGPDQTTLAPDSTRPADARAAVVPGAAAQADSQTGTAPVKAYKRPTPEVYQRLNEQELAASADDPQLRRELIQERIPLVRDQYLLLQRRLKVDADRWQRFMEVMAEQELGIMAMLADCKKTTNCELVSIDADTAARYKQAITEVLGDSGAAAVEKFRQSGMQRMALSSLDTELPENQKLSEAQSEELIDALTQTHMDVEKDMQKHEASVGRFFDQGGMLIYDKGLATVEERLADAANYSKKLRAQAARYLQGAQMAAFNRQQDRLLEAMRQSQAKAAPPG
jgi:hypothetical protein